MKKFFVVGSPIYHSKSPDIFGELFKKTGIEGYYSKLSLNEFDEICDVARNLGIHGVNVTSPFKKRAYEICLASDARVSQEALLSESVNCVLFNSGKIVECTNTDVSALVSILGSLFERLNGKKLRIALLGAGGAAQAVLVALKILNVDNVEVTLFNRTYEKAYELSKRFEVFPERLNTFIQIYKSFDIVVNCLSDYPENFSLLDFDDNQIFIDANYRKRVNVHGGVYIPGEVWLIKQALEAFRFFTKTNIDDSVYDALFKKIGTLDRTDRKGKIVYLVGMPGSGKSTVGKVLASALGFELVDMDKLIEKRVGMSINDIFSKYSEAYFRKIESEVLSEVSKFERVVVSTGGGVVLREENRRILKQGHVVWLWSDIQECAKRVFRKNNRPLLSSDSFEELVSKMDNLLSNRLEYYLSVADLVLPVDRLNVSQVAERLQRELGSYV